MRVSTALFLIASVNAVFGTLLTLLWAYGVLMPQVDDVLTGWLFTHGFIVASLYAAAGVVRSEENKKQNGGY